MSRAEIISIAERIDRVQERIAAALERAGRRDAVTLVAVTKAVEPDRIAEGYRCGLRHFGENRVQEFEAKRRQLALPEAIWHMVGHIQSNKARRAAEIFDCLDSVDSAAIGEKLSAAAVAAGRRLPALVQVNLGGEETKSGVAPETLEELVERLRQLPGLEIKGLMTLPPYLEPAERVRPYFRGLQELAEKLRLPELSMGMSHDFEVAIEEGATQVRVGTALFGERSRR